jgi:hypothetical protein
MLRKIIRGKLIALSPKNEETNWHWGKLLSEISLNRELHSLINYDREWYGSDSVWSTKGCKVEAEANTVEFNSPSPIWDGREDFTQFVNELKELMGTESAVALGLTGSFEIIMDTEKLPLVFRVEAKEGAVTYREAEYITWTETVTV